MGDIASHVKELSCMNWRCFRSIVLQHDSWNTRGIPKFQPQNIEIGVGPFYEHSLTMFFFLEFHIPRKVDHHSATQLAGGWVAFRNGTRAVTFGGLLQRMYLWFLGHSYLPAFRFSGMHPTKFPLRYPSFGPHPGDVLEHHCKNHRWGLRF